MLSEGIFPGAGELPDIGKSSPALLQEFDNFVLDRGGALERW
jgi:hypothetical protein